ncbi:MAG: hypothetical protein KDK99_03575 [Verrucomicrobiales bacterium]|nr:hypothetical protein [Verrucomicrobiales bacterium]
MIFNALVLLLLLLSFVLQEFIPAVSIAHYASLFLPVVFFLTASAATSFPMMLLMAFVTGFIWDARFLPLAADRVQMDAGLLSPDAVDQMALAGGDLSFGISIVLFGVMGALMQGIRPLFKRGRLELPVLMVGVSVFLWLAVQYLLMTFLRGSVAFSQALWSKAFTDTLLAMLVAPLLFLLLHTLARLTQFEIRYDGLRYNFNGR